MHILSQPRAAQAQGPIPALRQEVTARRHVLGRPAFIFAVALVLRLATGAIFLHDANLTIDSVGFSNKFIEGFEAVGIAHSLANGNGFSAPWPGAGPTAWITPVMPAILAADMLVFGSHSRATVIAFIIFNELCSALTVLPVFFAAKRIAGGQGAHLIGGLAAWLWVLNPAAGISACHLIWYTTLSALLAALLLWATVAIRDSQTPVAWILYGLLWGAQLMTHPSFLVLMPIALLWLVWPNLGSKRLMLAAIACLTSILCCVPWTVRNFVVFHHIIPFRSNFGLELWRYNHDGLPVHPNAPGRERDAFSTLGEYAYTHEKQHEALTWIGAHPGAFMRGAAQRVMWFWFDRDNPLKWLTSPRGWFWKVKVFYISALLAMNLAGLISIQRKRREYFWLLAAFPAIFPLVYYVALAREFHRFPIDPILAIIAALAVTAWLPTQPGLARRQH